MGARREAKRKNEHERVRAALRLAWPALAGRLRRMAVVCYARVGRLPRR